MQIYGSGWANSEVRTNLNGTKDEIGGYGSNLSNKKYIKKVEKLYLMPNSTTLVTCNDWLWNLSCAEIWNVGAEQGVVGFAKGREGEQYCFYKKNVGDSISSSYLIKKTSETGTAKNWPLRSHIFIGKDWTYVSNSGGIGSTYGHGKPVGIQCGIAPGFAI